MTQNNKELPVILNVHGGALTNGDREFPDWDSPEMQEFLAKNPDSLPPVDLRALAKESEYAFVSIDYEFEAETKLPEIISDIEEKFRWMAGEGSKQFKLDARNIVVVGGTVGGHLTVVTAYRAKPKQKAFVALYGFGDMTGDRQATLSSHPGHKPLKVTPEEGTN